MKLVKQKHYTACGVASLAMVADITYRRAMKLLHPKRFWWFSDASTSSQQMMDVLDQLGISYTFYIDQDKDFHLLGKRAIVSVKYGTIYHAVVWDPEKQIILDPYRGGTISLEYCLENFLCSIVIEDVDNSASLV
jgi:ABC-type bacteriocin/lantibiotic exporter with double-glycine peptidase domain